MADGNGGRDLVFSGMPWWVRAIALVGVPAIISLWLVGLTTGSLSSAVADNGMKIAANDKRIAEMAADDKHRGEQVTMRFEQLQRSAETQTRILRSICQSVAKTDLQRDRCTE